VRRRIKDKKVDEVRRKVLEATKNVKEEDKLCNRTSLALDFLLSYRQLSHVLQALIHLGRCLLWQFVLCVCFYFHSESWLCFN